MDRDASIDNRLHVTAGLDIPLSELRFRFSRSSGPGGQHVNRSETRVELVFDVANSPSLTEEQRSRLLVRLAPYLDATGSLRLVSQLTRSQLRNRQELIERFRLLMATALIEPRRRRPTKPPAAARERRLAAKRRVAEIKRLRRYPDIE